MYAFPLSLVQLRTLNTISYPPPHPTPPHISLPFPPECFSCLLPNLVATIHLYPPSPPPTYPSHSSSVPYPCPVPIGNHNAFAHPPHSPVRSTFTSALAQLRTRTCFLPPPPPDPLSSRTFDFMSSRTWMAFSGCLPFLSTTMSDVYVTTFGVRPASSMSCKSFSALRGKKCKKAVGRKGGGVGGWELGVGSEGVREKAGGGGNESRTPRSYRLLPVAYGYHQIPSFLSLISHAFSFAPRPQSPASSPLTPLSYPPPHPLSPTSRSQSPNRPQSHISYTSRMSYPLSSIATPLPPAPNPCQGHPLIFPHPLPVPNPNPTPNSPSPLIPYPLSASSIPSPPLPYPSALRYGQLLTTASESLLPLPATTAPYPRKH